MSTAGTAEAAHEGAESRVSELMGVVNSTTAALVVLIAEVLEAGAWAVSGIRSVEHWVAWQCGVSPRRARDLVAMARRRAELPAVFELFEAGLVTEDAVAAVVRRVPDGRDGEVAELLPLLLHSQLKRWLSTMPALRAATGDAETGAHVAHDYVIFGAVGDRWRMRVELPLDEGMVVEKALSAARSQVFRERHPDEPEVAIGLGRSSVDWTDGLARVAELALQAVDGRGERRPADRYQVLVHLDGSTGEARWHMGDVLPDSVRRYLCCDADVRALIERNGALVAMSSRMRTVDDRMRAFVEHRDGGCVIPGCNQKRWLHIHHIEFWEDGGRTESSNLCALCPRHHRLLHAKLLTIEGDPDTPFGLVCRDSTGREMRPVPPKPPDRPPDPPPEPFQHPVGERIDWRYMYSP